MCSRSGSPRLVFLYKDTKDASDISEGISRLRFCLHSKPIQWTSFNRTNNRFESFSWVCDIGPDVSAIWRSSWRLCNRLSGWLCMILLLSSYYPLAQHKAEAIGTQRSSYCTSVTIRWTLYCHDTWRDYWFGLLHYCRRSFFCWFPKNDRNVRFQVLFGEMEELWKVSFTGTG